MKTVVKALIYDESDNILILIRSNTHPHYANEDDLPGGELEGTENPIDSVIREIFEETGLTVDQLNTHEVLKLCIDINTRHILFICRIPGTRPNVDLSWEHSSYKWAYNTKVTSLRSGDHYISTVNYWLKLNKSSA